MREGLKIAKHHLQSINQNCYEHCVPKPGATLSKGEEGCLTACMEKYMSTWNTTSRAYIARSVDEDSRGVEHSID
jgi:import inner membrane translocase subunit TIM13